MFTIIQIAHGGSISSWRATAMQNLASALIKNGPHPANQILKAYLKTTGMCSGAGLELNSVALPPSRS